MRLYLDLARAQVHKKGRETGNECCFGMVRMKLIYIQLRVPVLVKELRNAVLLSGLASPSMSW